MVTLAGCVEFFSKIRHRGGRHRRLSSVNSEDFEQLAAADNSSKYPSQAAQRQYHQYQHNSSSDIYATPPLSPAGSSASGSSGALASGLPSPTGHCPSPDRAAMMRYAAKAQEQGELNKQEDMSSSNNIYLMEHSGIYLETTNESMLFVHKILKPIRTRIEDQEPVRAAEYKPLLQQLMAQSQSEHQNGNNKAGMQPSGPSGFKPSVIATITVGKKKENAVMRTNQHPVPIPVIS